jgi:CRISPR-associated protein (TIGR03985 family)
MPKLQLFPHFLVLQRLVDGSLNQSQNLITAMRRWVLINWFYGEGSDDLDCIQTSGFTFHQWSQDFFNQDLLKLQSSFQSGHPLGNLLEKNDEILRPHHQLCLCYKTTVDWLRFYNFSVDDWLKNLQQHIYVSEATVTKVIYDRLFAKVRKTLQADINTLIAKQCLRYKNSLLYKNNIICKVEKLPEWLSTEVSDKREVSSTVIPGLSSSELADLAQALDMLTFLDPKLAPIADKISTEVYGTRRVFLHIDYILPEDVQIHVDNLQEQLQENWCEPEIKPILFHYTSARLGAKKCLAYPVCIYYIQRAKYLCAYGVNPRGELNWYNYRLERIRALFFVDWQDKVIPSKLLEKYLKNQLPQPEDVEVEMSKTWGFDVNNASRLMLLRFNADYHRRYIQNTVRHNTFTKIRSLDKVAEVICKYAHSHGEAKLLHGILKKYPNDAYYTVMYRDRDYNVMMRLLAWGANVEVLLPMELRERIAQSVRETHKFYQDEESRVSCILK